MDISTKVTVILAVLYNILLANILVISTFNPLVIVFFIVVDLILILYYTFYVAVDSIKTRRFKKSHQDIISRAQQEVSDYR